MNSKPHFRLVALLLVCQLVLAACTPPQQAGSTTTGSTERQTTTTTATPSTTTVTPVPATGKKTTTVAKTKPTVTTTTRDINVLPTGTKTPAQFYKMPGVPMFSCESEDYDVLRKLILQKFPAEKSLKEFRVTKTKKKYTVLFENDDGTEYVQSQYNVEFRRWINGCNTDSYYTFYFDENDKCIAMRVNQETYDPAKVVPPRVATEAEIEAAKQEEAEKVPEGSVVWKQEVNASIYDIERDANYFTITTLYVAKQTYDAYLAGAFSAPPHAAYSGAYVIPR